MRQAIVAFGAGLALTLAATAASAESTTPANEPSAPKTAPGGPEWCGFHNKAGDRVRCGYSSASDCKRAIGEPDAICIIDPYLTEIRRLTASV